MCPGPLAPCWVLQGGFHGEPRAAHFLGNWSLGELPLPPTAGPSGCGRCQPELSPFPSEAPSLQAECTRQGWRAKLCTAQLTAPPGLACPRPSADGAPACLLSSLLPSPQICRSCESWRSVPETLLPADCGASRGGVQGRLTALHLEEADPGETTGLSEATGPCPFLYTPPSLFPPPRERGQEDEPSPAPVLGGARASA